ncbi:uncharacterized protein G2W53_020914 [Senna tora]|uniref:DUF4408 domain-containing protein n=1 Tax=Senna tora TaxID=362788 RepID=A0A834WGQ4_9FABA|nr:uncharacterized protein G2W53_020914 [Senna tora]
MASFLSLKLVLLSTGVLSMALALKLTVPVVSDFILNEGPSMWTFILTCLRPPYLFILMNGIIVTIVASSKLQHHKLDHQNLSTDDAVILPSVQSLATQPVKISGDLPTDYNNTVVQSLAPEPIAISGDVLTEANVREAKISKVNDKEVVNGSDEAGKSVLTSVQRKDSLDLSYSFQNENEKPLVSSRFGHRKAVKGSPEGGKAALRVTKAKRQETLESTWKTITEGRAMPLTRHLKKSDTWDSQQRRNAPLTDQNGAPPMKKSETFSERSKTGGENCSAGSGRLKKEASLSQDELNRRVEAFINKFNEEMRLQRQESLRQYQEMIRRGAH